MIDGRNFFDQPIKNGIKTYVNIRKMFFIIKEVKETILDFSQATAKVLKFYFVLI